MLHPQAAVMYHCLTLAARLLQRRPDLKSMFEILRQEEFISLEYGPFHQINQVIQSLDATWVSIFAFAAQEGLTIDLLNNDHGLLKPQVREALRCYVLRTNVAYQQRQDMEGGGILAYDINTRLIQQKCSKQVPCISLFQQSALRNFITGAVHTEQKLFKAHCAPSPVCPWCTSGAEETIEHLFWECEQWQDLRTDFQEKHHDVIPLLPTITRNCGLLPQAIIDDQTMPLAVARVLILDLQLMYLSLFEETRCC